MTRTEEWETIARWHIAECERLRNERSPYPPLQQSEMVEIESNGCATVKPRMDRNDGIFIRWSQVQVLDRSLYRRGLGLGLVVSSTQSGKGLAEDCYSELEAVQARWKEWEAQLASPIPMLLFCPQCNWQHVSKLVFAQKLEAAESQLRAAVRVVDQIKSLAEAWSQIEPDQKNVAVIIGCGKQILSLLSLNAEPK